MSMASFLWAPLAALALQGADDERQTFDNSFSGPWLGSWDIKPELCKDPNSEYRIRFTEKVMEEGTDEPRYIYDIMDTYREWHTDYRMRLLDQKEGRWHLYRIVFPTPENLMYMEEQPVQDERFNHIRRDYHYCPDPADRAE